MSILNSKFDIVSVDNPLAVASLAQVLEVGVFADPSAPTANEVQALYTGTGFEGGTPKAGTIAPGTIVMMDGTGKAVLGTATVAGSDTVAPVMPKLLFVAIDGNTDYSGSFVRKLTVLHGGFTMLTDQFDADGKTWTPGEAVTVYQGKVVPHDHTNAAGLRYFGFVGPAGYDATNGVLQVIVPQGAGI